MTVDTQRFTTILEGEDRLSPTLGSALGKLNQYEQGVHRVGRGMGQIAQGAGRLAAIGLGGAVAGLGASIKVAADFEEQLNTINTIAQATPEALGAIGDGLRGLSRTTGASLEDLTSAYYDLLSAGIQPGAEAQKVLEQAQRLSIGTLGTTRDAVDVLTTALNSYNLSADDAAAISEELAIAVRDGKVVLSEIAPVYADVAPLAATMGIETREIAAAFATLTSKGTAAGEVATQMRSALKALLDPSADLIALQERLGVRFADVAEEKGLIFALEQMRAAVGYDDEAFNKLFGRIEGFNFALATTGDNFADARDELDQFTGSTRVLDSQVAEREQGLTYQLGRLKTNLRDIGITIGSAVLPEFTPLIAEFTEFLAGNAPQIEQFAKDLAAGFRDLVVSVKETDWGPFLDTFGLMAEIGGKVVDIFRSLPPELQAIAITGLAVNKLSGGLLGAGVGNVARGLIQIVFQRGTTPANPLFVSSVGGLGGAPVAGGVGGVITSFLGLASATLLGGAIGVEIGRALIAPTLRPAVEFEESQFTRLLQDRDPTALQRGLDAINAGIDDIHSLGLAQLGFLPELHNLETQRDQLTSILTELQTAHAEETAAQGVAEAAARARGQELMAAVGASLAAPFVSVIDTSDAQLRDEVAELRQHNATVAAAAEASRRTTASQQAAEDEKTRGEVRQVRAANARLETPTRVSSAHLGILQGLQASALGALFGQRSLQSAMVVKLGEIARKATVFNTYVTVNSSASQQASQVNTYTQIRVGGVQP